MLYSEILDMWIDEKRREIRTSSCKNYIYTIKNHIKPNLGHCEVNSITKDIIQKFIYLSSDKYKRETVINMTKVITQSLNYAVEQSYIKETPYRKIKIPKDKGVKEIKIFTEIEVEKILNSSIDYNDIKVIVIIAYRTGMRIGEILTLKWEDINFNHKFLTVRRTLSDYTKEGKPEVCDPKTKASRRRIDLDNLCMEILNHKEKISDSFIFCKENGSIYSRQYVSKSFRKMCNSAGVKYKSFHALRHTHASILLSRGIHPKIVQERLGHSKISTTMDTYSHLIPGMQQLVVNVFNEIN